MKYRVERERTDQGYGPGWVVLDASGDVVTAPRPWAVALTAALELASADA